MLNEFNTIEHLEKDNITFASVRLKLLSKIYFNIKRGTLRTLKPQQLQISKSDEVKKELHNNIFKGNTFLLWFKYYENKNIDVTCKTDLRVIYELMKKDNCFQNTIELKHYINWLNSEFFDGAIMELKKQYFDSRPNQQRLKDYNEYKDNLKTTFK